MKLLQVALSILLFQGLSSAQGQTLKEAIRLNENEQQDEAASVYEKLIQQEPANGNLYYFLGENYLDAEMPEKAASAFSLGLQKDPANPINLIGQGELKLMSGDLGAGKALVDQAVKASGGKNALILMEAGEAFMRYRKAQDLISAQNYLETAAKLEPKNPEAFNLLGDLYSELNNGTVAAGHYNKALDLDKNQVKALLHKGQLYKRSTNFEGALVEFENCLKIDPNFAPAYREMGETYFKMRNMEKAKENYKKYLELSRNNSNARLRYAYFLFESEDFKSAQSELDKISKADSSNLYMMRIIGYVALENDLPDTARRALSRVFILTADDTSKRISKDYAYYGRTLARTGNDSLGIEYLTIAIEMDPRFSEHYDDLGKMATKSKKHHLAVGTYRKKIERHHKVNSSDYYNLGRALYSNKEFVGADSAFLKVTELSPNWATGYLYLGRTRSQIDTLFADLSAIPPYEKYIQITGADAASSAKYSKELIEANSYIAVAYLRKKDCRKSLEFWNNVLAIDPKVQQAIDAIRIIKDSKDCK